ncbi:ABC1 kinase family protein [Devriesea agamarum]|uniref:ABC1 kinase family protein n=1 Tax=Devriesea agamarum TaxID=472569 RepID=UPI00071DFDC1|nr:AarF/ABC1/UbiB kinase family protein [Devriesea agamarum]
MPRHSERYREIAEVLARSGWSVVANEVGLRTHLLRWRKNRVQDAALTVEGTDQGEPHGDASTGSENSHSGHIGDGHNRSGRDSNGNENTGPARLRRAFEDLGPTFVKLGQLLSTREDILPAAYVRELSKLQDGTASVDGDTIVKIVEEELGGDLSTVYSSFEREPLASASIGQTHRARLRDGRDVVVKVRKPGVSRMVTTDLEILQNLASVASREWAAANDYDIVGIVDYFAEMLRAELDYLTEARNAVQFAKNLAGDRLVHVPQVIWEATTSRILTEEYVSGMRITDTEALDEAGVDRSELADAATRTIVRMVLVDGFFHADPHPGNLFVRPDGGLWLIDFGMVGRLSARTREDILRLLIALRHNDAEAAASALMKLAPPRRRVDRRALVRDVSILVHFVGGQNFANLAVMEFFQKLTALLRDHRLQLPPEVAALLRMLVLTESSAAVLDPDFHLTQVLGQVGIGTLFEQWSPASLAKHLADSGLHAMRVATNLPERGLSLLEDYEARGLEVRISPEDLEPIIERLEGTADRLIAGITMGALFVGIGSVLASGQGRTARFRDPLMLVAGGASALLGIYLSAGGGPARGVRRAITRLGRGLPR